MGRRTVDMQMYLKKMTGRAKRKNSPCRSAALVLLTVFLLTGLTGCGQKEPAEVVLTTGFKKNEVFQLETASCSKEEALIYLMNERNRYEAVYGAEIWDEDVSGGELQDRLKENVLAEISQIKAMTLLAEKNGVVLEAEELEKVQAASQEYFDSLTDTERDFLDASVEVIAGMYQDYALADKVYGQIIADINPEISDDEARIITVQRILIRTGEEDGSSEEKSIEEAADDRQEAYRTAKEVYSLAQEGESFELLMEKYSEAEEGTLLFGKGEREAAFEEAAFALGTNEISGIVETSEGFEIIKCINTFNREETDRNKLKIVERRRDEVFGQEYDAFVESLVGNLNEKLWDSIVIPTDIELTNCSFFEIYNQYFE